jgi:hypothetical protein
LASHKPGEQTWPGDIPFHIPLGAEVFIMRKLQILSIIIGIVQLVLSTLYLFAPLRFLELGLPAI